MHSPASAPLVNSSITIAEAILLSCGRRGRRRRFGGRAGAVRTAGGEGVKLVSHGAGFGLHRGRIDQPAAGYHRFQALQLGPGLPRFAVEGGVHLGVGGGGQLPDLGGGSPSRMGAAG